MATSRTGTSVYLKARARLRRAAKLDGAPCALCGKPIDYTLHTPDPGSFEADHIVPVARGGTDAADNLQAVHRSCNRAKGDKYTPPAPAQTARTVPRWFHTGPSWCDNNCPGHTRRWIDAMELRTPA